LRAGILFSVPFSFDRSAFVLELLTVPFEIVLRRQHQGVAPRAAEALDLCQAPVRGSALSIDPKAARIGHDDEAVMLQLTIPSADTVAMAAHFVLCLPL
jgi:hypothetical protein